MFVTPSGDKVFIVDGHIHLWDARAENRRNRYGLSFIESFWGAHVGMTPIEQRWDFDRFCHYGVEGAAKSSDPACRPFRGRHDQSRRGCWC